MKLYQKIREKAAKLSLKLYGACNVQSKNCQNQRPIQVFMPVYSDDLDKFIIHDKKIELGNVILSLNDEKISNNFNILLKNFEVKTEARTIAYFLYDVRG